MADKENQNTPVTNDDTQQDSHANAQKEDAVKEKIRHNRKNLESKLSTLDNRINESSASNAISFLAPFYSANYDKPDIPEEAIDYDDDGNAYIIPQVLKPWVCRYYYSPDRKARLARHSAYSVAIIFVSVMSSFSQVNGGLSALVLGVLLLVNFQFRYHDLALWKWPMPEIPFLSSIDFGKQYSEAKERIEEEARARQEYEEMVEEGGSVEFIEPVDDYRDGNPSPATILTNWMNMAAQMDKQEFIDASDGKLNSFTMNLILEDNEGAWRDETILDTVSYITKTNAQDWLDAYELWEKSKD